MSGQRRLPGKVRQCSACRAPIVFARTVASERGKGGKLMPLDAEPHPEGNVAVRTGLFGGLTARVLGKDDAHDRTSEVLAMPHFATCLAVKGARDVVKGAEQLLRDAASGGGGTS